jgi:menaquinone-dependent protoporphyrinogen oxidase
MASSRAIRLGLEQTDARSHHVFGGRLDRKHLSLGERAIVGLVRAPDGDYRPWDKIRAWSAHDLADAR